MIDCVPKGEKDALITQEAAAAMGTSHPHLVTTYKYAIKYHEKGAPNDQVKIHEDGKPLLPGTAECWLFMEMCNKGTLQVRSPSFPIFCTLPAPLRPAAPLPPHLKTHMHTHHPTVVIRQCPVLVPTASTDSSNVC